MPWMSRNETLLYRDAFTHRSFYTQKLWHTDAVTHRSFYTQMLLHTDTFTHRRFYTHRSFYTQTLLHTPFYTQTLLHTDAFTHRRSYTQTLFTHRCFYTQKLSHTEAFTHKHFHTQRPDPWNRTFTSILPQAKKQLFGTRRELPSCRLWTGHGEGEKLHPSHRRKQAHCWRSGAGADFWLSAFRAAIPAAFQRGGRMPSIGTGPRPADRVLPRTEGDLDQGSGAPPSGSATEGWSWIATRTLPVTDEHH